MNAHDDAPPGAEYVQLVQEYWLNGGEEPLIRAADLGKKLVHDGLPPEDIGEFQQQALLELSRTLAATELDEIAARLTPPLIEVRLDIAGEPMIANITRDAAQALNLSVGQAVTVRIAPDQVVLLAAEGGPGARG